MIATSIEQSKKLLELGINHETADMHWYGDESFTLDVGYSHETYLLYASSKFNYIPAWSLSALLRLMPYYTLQTTSDGNKVFCVSVPYISKEYDNPIDAAVEMIKCLITNKHLNYDTNTEK